MPTFSSFVSDQWKTLPVVATPQECEGKTYIITGANIGTLAADVVTGKFKALLEKSRDEVCPRNYRI